jgi:hypothetical protein
MLWGFGVFGGGGGRMAEENLDRPQSNFDIAGEHEYQVLQ